MNNMVWLEYVIQFYTTLVRWVSLYGTDFEDFAIIYKHLDNEVKEELINIAS